MKDMLFHDCANYAHLMGIIKDADLHNIYGNRFVALYDMIAKLNLVDEFIEYQIEFDKQFEKDC